MILYLVRHAIVELRGEDWPDDALRPLTDRGRKRMRQIAQRLAVRGVEVSRHGERVCIQARKGVLLATGAYGGNSRLATWFDEVPPRGTRRAPGASPTGGSPPRASHLPDLGFLLVPHIGDL